MQQYRVSRASLLTTTAETLTDLLEREIQYGTITSVLDMKSCILKTYFCRVAQIKLIFFSCV